MKPFDFFDIFFCSFLEFRPKYVSLDYECKSHHFHSSISHTGTELDINHSVA